MDYHALQKKLFDMDPTDPRKDFEKLMKMGQAASAPSALVEANIPQASYTPMTDNLNLDSNSAQDFAKLAGIKPANKIITETKYVAEQDPPSTVGGMVDAFKRGTQSSSVASNALRNALGNASAGSGGNARQASRPGSGRIAGGPSGIRVARDLGVADETLFARGFERIKKGQEPSFKEKAALGDGFAKIMRMEDTDLRRFVNLIITLKNETVDHTEPNLTQTNVTETTAQDLKAMLKEKLSNYQKSKK